MKRLVLVVEDDANLRSGMAALIGGYGHEVITAATVAEGLRQLGAGPSHLMLDLNLPDGVGTTILRHVRDGKLPVRVAILSGSGDDDLMAEARGLSPEAMFKKPPNWDALMAWVDA